MLALCTKDRYHSVEKPLEMGTLNITPDSFCSNSYDQQLE